MAIAATLIGVAVPLTTSGLDEMRTAMAARYMAGRLLASRLEAVQRSTRVALRFEPGGGDYVFATYADGNRNGVRTTEIADGTDRALGPGERLGEQFTDVRFGLAAGVPDLDGVRQVDDSEGVRIGFPRILTLSPDGTATSGTLYIRGRRGQYAVRVLGATARTRVFQYQAGAGAWTVR